MSDDVDHDDLDCPKCGASEVYSQPCWKGCDDGYFDGYQDDPLWYDPGDLIVCDECHGRGLLRWCQACGADLTRHRWDTAAVTQPKPATPGPSTPWPASGGGARG